MRESGEQPNSVRTRAEGEKARLTVDIVLKPKLGKDNLKAKYGVAKYDLATGFVLSEALKQLVPKNTPEYVEKGNRYVERIMRALYHFKQCALIGPSGTGKSVCGDQFVYAILDGRPIHATMESLFELLARTRPTMADREGWETILLGQTDIVILSLNTTTGQLEWSKPDAMARSKYSGRVATVRTKRNRVLRATPEHSFITSDGVSRSGRLRQGTLLPVARHLPLQPTPEVDEVALAEYVSNAMEVEAGLVDGTTATSIQIPAPGRIRLGPDFSWFIGFFVAEGYIGHGFASVYNKKRSFITRSKAVVDSLGLSSSQRRQRGLTELRIFSKVFVTFLSNTTVRGKTGRGKGSQARFKRVPEFVFSAPESSKLSFLRGFYDGNGWLEEGSELVLGTSSKELADGLIILCESLGMFPTLRVKGRAVQHYSLVLTRADAARMGVRLPKAPGGTDSRGHVEKVRVTPSMIEAARRAYSNLPSGVRSKKLHKDTVDHLYSSTGFVGLNTLRRIAETLHSGELLSVALSNVLWDQVEEVRFDDYDGWVYDFQVDGNQTFVAGLGGVATHNTHIVYLVAELAGLPLWEINCGLQTSVYDLFGRFVGLGKENWVDGQIVSWCRYGGILYLDEANMMKQDVATRLNPLLDTRGHMVLTEKDNEVIPRHPHGYVIISMNPYSAEFAGTKPLNAAFRRRMSVWVDFDYLSVGTKVSQDEVEMIAQRSKVSPEVSEGIVRVAAEMRRRYVAGDLPYGPSVGDLLNWATLVADGLSPLVAAEETIVTLTSDDAEVQNAVRRVVRMVFGEAKDVAV